MKRRETDKETTGELKRKTRRERGTSQELTFNSTRWEKVCKMENVGKFAKWRRG